MILCSALNALVKENNPVKASALFSQSAMIYSFVTAKKRAVCPSETDGMRRRKLFSVKGILYQQLSMQYIS